MSEVNRYAAGEIFDGAEVVYAADFDRVTAECDALRNEVGQVKGEYDRAVNKVNALQQRLTAADERADVLEGLLLQTNELLYVIQGEPVATIDRARKIEQLRGAFEQRFKLDIWPVIDWLRNSGLYAEQPAPVAVVMPERRADAATEDQKTWMRGWNACLDELKRLNTKE